MRRLKLTIVAFLLATSYVSAQQDDDSMYESVLTIASIDEKDYVNAMKGFRLDTLCSDEVLVTHLKSRGSKNRYVNKEDVRSYLLDIYGNKSERVFKLSVVTNNGYVIVVGQYGKDPDIPVRYFTLFLDPITAKINVIEVSENR